MDVDAIEQAYKYLSFANGNSNWVNWKYLAPNDPGRGFLQSIGAPPVEATNPQDFALQEAYRQMQLPAEQRDFTALNMLPFDVRNALQYQTEYRTTAAAIRPESSVVVEADR